MQMEQESGYHEADLKRWLTGIGMVNTVLAGFIAYSIADKPAIGAGLIGGAVSSTTLCRDS